MGRCCAAYCANSTISGIGMFLFPKDPLLQRKWCENINRRKSNQEPFELWTNAKFSSLCASHFEDHCFTISPTFAEKIGYKCGKLRLNPDAVPTIFPEPEDSGRKKGRLPFLKLRSQKAKMPPKKKPAHGQRSVGRPPGSSAVLRRQSRTDVELMMECEEEELSPAQLSAMKQAQQEHEKANNLILAARAGNTLVPSSQPNTFTVVPPKPIQALPIATKTQTTHTSPSSAKTYTVSEMLASQRLDLERGQMNNFTVLQKQLAVPVTSRNSSASNIMQQVNEIMNLPPPRPRQFLDRSQKKTEDDDIMIIGESPPRPSSKILMNLSMKSPNQIVSQSGGVTPTQVYKFVNPHGNPTQQAVGGQWLIRPILSVPPQQQQQQSQRQIAPIRQVFASPVPVHQHSSTSRLGVKGQGHSIQWLQGHVLTASAKSLSNTFTCKERALWTKTCLERSPLNLQNQCSEISACCDKFQHIKRTHLIKYYLDRYFQMKSYSDLKFYMDVFFKKNYIASDLYKGSDSIANNSVIYSPNKLHISHEKELDGKKNCDRMVNVVSAFNTGSLPPNDILAESKAVCDKNIHVPYTYDHTQLREYCCKCSTQYHAADGVNGFSSGIGHWELSHCCRLGDTVHCDFLEYKRCQNKRLTCKTLWKYMRWFDSPTKHYREKTCFDKDKYVIRTTYPWCSNTSFIRPPVQIHFVYPLYDFKNSNSEAEQNASLTGDIPKRETVQIKITGENSGMSSATEDGSTSDKNRNDLESKNQDTELSSESTKTDKSISKTGATDLVTESENLGMFYSSLNGDLTDKITDSADSAPKEIDKSQDFPDSGISVEAGGRSLDQLSDKGVESDSSEQSNDEDINITGGNKQGSDVSTTMVESLKHIMQKSSDIPWYSSLPAAEIQQVVQLCRRKGWTNISKTLHIPKIQLLTWRRTIKKSTISETVEAKTHDLTDLPPKNEEEVEESMDHSLEGGLAAITEKSTKCSTKSSQNDDNVSNKDTKLQASSTSGTLGSDSVKGISKDLGGRQERPVLSGNCNSDGRLHPPKQSELSIGNSSGTVSDLNKNCGIRNDGKMSQETSGNNSVTKRSNSLNTMIDRLKKNLVSQTSNSPNEVVPDGAASEKDTESTDSDGSSDDDSSSDSYGLVIDTDTSEVETDSQEKSDEDSDGHESETDKGNQSNHEVENAPEINSKINESVKENKGIEIDNVIEKVTTKTNESVTKIKGNEIDNVTEKVTTKTEESVTENKGNETDNVIGSVITKANEFVKENKGIETDNVTGSVTAKTKEFVKGNENIFVKDTDNTDRANTGNSGNDNVKDESTASDKLNFDKATNLYVPDHCYLGSLGSVPEEVSEHGEAVKEADLEANNESDDDESKNVWMPADDSGQLTFPQNEWYILNGRKIRVFSQFSGEKRKQLQKRIEHRGINKVSSKLKIPADYLESVVGNKNVYHDVQMGEKQVEVRRIVTRLSGMESESKTKAVANIGEFVSLNTLCDEMSTEGTAVGQGSSSGSFHPTSDQVSVDQITNTPVFVERLRNASSSQSGYPGEILTHVLTPEIKKNIVDHSYKVGREETCKRYKISIKTLTQWRNQVMMQGLKALKANTDNEKPLANVKTIGKSNKMSSDDISNKLTDLREHTEINEMELESDLTTDKYKNVETSSQSRKEMTANETKIETKKMSDYNKRKVKRVVFSHQLKVKIAHLATAHGITYVSKQYNIGANTIRGWLKLYRDFELKSYEFTEEDLKQLVTNNERKMLEVPVIQSRKDSGGNLLHVQIETVDTTEKSKPVPAASPRTDEQSESFEEIYSWKVQSDVEKAKVKLQGNHTIGAQTMEQVDLNENNPSCKGGTGSHLNVMEQSGPRNLSSLPNRTERHEERQSSYYENSDMSVVSAYYGVEPKVPNRTTSAIVQSKETPKNELVKLLNRSIKTEPINDGYEESANPISQHGIQPEMVVTQASQPIIQPETAALNSNPRLNPQTAVSPCLQSHHAESPDMSSSFPHTKLISASPTPASSLGEAAGPSTSSSQLYSTDHASNYERGQPISCPRVIIIPPATSITGSLLVSTLRNSESQQMDIQPPPNNIIVIPPSIAVPSGHLGDDQNRPSEGNSHLRHESAELQNIDESKQADSGLLASLKSKVYGTSTIAMPTESAEQTFDTGNNGPNNSVDSAKKNITDKLNIAVTEKDLEVEKALKNALLTLNERKRSDTNETRNKDQSGSCNKAKLYFKSSDSRNDGQRDPQSSKPKQTQSRIGDLINSISNRVMDKKKGPEHGGAANSDDEDESSSADDDTSFTESADGDDSSDGSKDQTDTASDAVGETPNLSDKLKSLLEADIFTSIKEAEAKGGAETETRDMDDLQIISAKSTDKSIDKYNTKGVQRSLAPAKVTGRTEESPTKRITYSARLKMRLGHLCNANSLSSISRKFNIQTKTLAKWRDMYKDTEKKEVDLTQDDINELKRIQESKTSPAKSNKEKYDIYIDNPESETDCVILDENPSESVSGVSKLAFAQNIAKPIQALKPDNNAKVQVSADVQSDDIEKDTIPNDIPKMSEFNRLKEKFYVIKSLRSKGPNILRKSSHISRPSSKPVASFNNLGNEVPLYFALDESVTGEAKKNLRQKIVRPSSGWHKGVFLESTVSEASTLSKAPKSSSPGIVTKASPTSTIGHGESGIKDAVNSPKSGVLGSSVDPIESSKGISDGIHAEAGNKQGERGESVGKQSDTYSAIFEQTNNLIAELNSHVSQDESQNKHSSRNPSGDTSPSTSSLNIRLADLKSHFIRKGHTIEGITIAHDSPENIETDSIPSGKTSSSPKAVHVTLRRTMSTENGTPAKKASMRSLSMEKEEETFDKIEKEGSFLWKWKIVREARTSGFGATALSHKVNMAEIMQWHDDFVKDSELNLKLKAAQHALLYGLSDAANFFKVKKEFITDLFKSKKPASISKGLGEKDPIAAEDVRVAKETHSINKSSDKGLEFETLERADGKIRRPKFHTKDSMQPTTVGSDELRTTQKTRMGPNTISYSSSSRKDHFQGPATVGDGFNKDAYMADTRANLGTMPRLVKQPTYGAGGVEIASTWKQIQSVINPQKPLEKRYTPEFKNRIIKECEEKGQKIVSKEQRIPYNEISRWRLEARKAILLKMKPTEPVRAKEKNYPSRSSTSHSKEYTTVYPPEAESGLVSYTSEVYIDKDLDESATSTEELSDKGPEKFKESLKIKIKLNKKPKVVQNEGGKDNVKQASHALTGNTRREEVQILPKIPVISREKRKASVHAEEEDLKLEVVDYCIQFGVLKTQKKFGLIRQSIVDLMQEYDKYCKTSFDYNTRSVDIKNMKTKLITREKTSVEETRTVTPSVVMLHNLKDYIVTQEYKDSVAEYARDHGITAATRKFKRKTSTVKSWMGHYAQRHRKMKKVEELMKQAQAEFGVRNTDADKESGMPGLSVPAAKSPRTAESSEPTSPVWDQDFVIKPYSGKGPLKMTLSPRRKSPMIMMSNDEDQKETESDGEGDLTEEYEEVTTWEDTEEGDEDEGNKLDTNNDQRKPTDTQTPSKPTTFTVINRSTKDKNPGIKDTGVKSTTDGVYNSKEDLKKEDSSILIRPTDVPNILEISGFLSDGLSSAHKFTMLNETDRYGNQSSNALNVTSEEQDDTVKYGNKSSDLSNATGNKTVDTIDKINLTDDRHVEKILSKKHFSGNADRQKAKYEKTNSKSESQQSKQIETKFGTNLTPAEMCSRSDVVIAIERYKPNTTCKSENKTPENTSNNKDSNTSKERKTVEKSPVPVVKETQENIPYAETIMFKLFNSNVESFFTTPPTTQNTLLSQRDEAKSVVSDTASNADSTKGKGKPTKRARQSADFEIIKNIDETCLFGSSRILKSDNEERTEVETGNSVPTDIKENALTANTVEEACMDIVSDCTQDNVAMDDAKSSSNEEKEVPIVAKEADKVPDADDDHKEDVEQTDTEISAVMQDSIDKVEKERSLFDFFTIAKEEMPKEQKEASPITSANEASEEKEDEKPLENVDCKQNEEIKSQEEKNTQEVEKGTSAFSLFGNLMKSFKMPARITPKKDDASIKTEVKVTPPIAKPANVDVDAPLEKAEDVKLKERGERNLFDFILPTAVKEADSRDEEKKAEIVNIKPELDKPTSSKIPTSLQGSKSPVKSLFKFNKLPVNFGNIAKLGMAHLKKDESKPKVEEKTADKTGLHAKLVDKSENKTADIKAENSDNVRKVVGDSPQVSKDSKHLKSSIVGNSQKTVPKPGVVMETFEELRKRLAQKRAANRLEREKTPTSPEQSDQRKPEGEHTTPKKDAEKVDHDMFKEFPAHKVTLIVDIAKKHGIAFASSSFDLSASVIVNWIIEKERKHRKISSGTSLETKLTVVGEMAAVKEGDIPEISKKYNVNVPSMLMWSKELQWLVERKDVRDVLNKWQTVESMTSLENPTRKSRMSVLEKIESEPVKQSGKADSEHTGTHDKDGNDVTSSEAGKDTKGNTDELTKDAGDKCDKKPDTRLDEVDGDRLEQHKTDRVLTEIKANVSSDTLVEMNNQGTSSKGKSGDVIDDKSQQEGKSMMEGSPPKESKEANVVNTECQLPGVLDFTRHLHPRDYNLEQKSMIVLLVDKFGIKEVHNKLGINKGTLWTWKNQNRGIKQFIHEQTSGIRVHRVVVSAEKTTDEFKTTTAENDETIDGKTEIGKDIHVNSSGKMVKDKVSSGHHKGYRLISPTKIPDNLKKAREIQTKDYTFEQRVALVKLVELYGVRTVHKQFRIPQGSIWNWQHAKSITQELRKEETELETSPVKRSLQFGTGEEGTNPVNIDVLLDRALVAMDTTHHFHFNYHQKSDVVCLIDYYGLQYVCDKIQKIPRGTLWNWSHNKHVRTLVERQKALIQKSKNKEVGDKEADLMKVSPPGQSNRSDSKKGSEPLDTTGKGSVRDSVTSRSRRSEAISEAPASAKDGEENFKEPVSEVVDKAAMTQDWVSACLQDTGVKRKADGAGRQTWNSGGGGDVMKKQCKTKPDKTTDDWNSNIGLDGVCSEKDFLRSLGPGHCQSSVVGSASMRSKDQVCSRTRTSSFSSFSSIMTDETNEFEEILTDDELNTSSSYSKISGGEPAKSMGVVVCPELKESLLPELKWNFLSSLPFDTTDVDLNRTFDILQIEEGPHSRLMVSYKIETEDERNLELAKKKPRKDSIGEIDQSGQWVPLDEYYYGTVEGDSTITNETEEFRFKCWYCSKMLYNNVRAMQHIQGHIDSSKQQNMDLSDLTQCKHCYKQFDTPFEMQTHVEKVHLGNKVLMCRICEKDFGSTRDLIMHMRQCHLPCEMPYHCQVCGFRSSMYSDVVDHFKKKHDSTDSMLCLYCLRVFKIRFMSQGWGQTQTYYGHLLKHQAKTSMKKCNVCRLMFFNPLDVKNHRKNCHVSFKEALRNVTGSKETADDQLMIKVSGKEKSQLKSLNAPSVSRIQDYRDVRLPSKASSSFCLECKMTMSSLDHYKKYVHCSLCRFATSCSVAYANHMMGFHSGQISSLNLNIPRERPVSQTLYCMCSFSTKYGTKMANHLVACGKRVCSTNKPELTDVPAADKKNDERRSEGGIFGALGLVQKKSVATRVRTLESAMGEPKLEKTSSQDTKTSRKRTLSPSPPVKPEKSAKTDNASELGISENKGSQQNMETDEPVKIKNENEKNMAKKMVEIKDGENNAISQNNFGGTGMTKIKEKNAKSRSIEKVEEITDLTDEPDDTGESKVEPIEVGEDKSGTSEEAQQVCKKQGENVDDEEKPDVDTGVNVDDQEKPDVVDTEVNDAITTKKESLEPELETSELDKDQGETSEGLTEAGEEEAKATTCNEDTEVKEAQREQNENEGEPDDMNTEQIEELKAEDDVTDLEAAKDVNTDAVDDDEKNDEDMKTVTADDDEKNEKDMKTVTADDVETKKQDDVNDEKVTEDVDTEADDDKSQNTDNSDVHDRTEDEENITIDDTKADDDKSQNTDNSDVHDRTEDEENITIDDTEADDDKSQNTDNSDVHDRTEDEENITIDETGPDDTDNNTDVTGISMEMGTDDNSDDVEGRNADISDVSIEHGSDKNPEDVRGDEIESTQEISGTVEELDEEEKIGESKTTGEDETEENVDKPETKNDDTTEKEETKNDDTTEKEETKKDDTTEKEDTKKDDTTEKEETKKDDTTEKEETKKETTQVGQPHKTSTEPLKPDRSGPSEQGNRPHSSSSSSGQFQEDRQRQADRSQERYQRDDRRGSHRPDDRHGDRQYDRSRDRDRSHERDYHHGDNRRDNRYAADNRGGQGYRGQGGYRGQQGGGYHHGNRGGGGYNQDRNFNRNRGNRGGNRGGYNRGGYY